MPTGGAGRLKINEFLTLRSLFGKQSLLRRLGVLHGLGRERHPIITPLKLKGLLNEFADIGGVRVPLGERFVVRVDEGPLGSRVQYYWRGSLRWLYVECHDANSMLF